MCDLSCKDCLHKFSITDKLFDDFINDMETIIKCPNCNSYNIKSEIVKW